VTEDDPLTGRLRSAWAARPPAGVRPDCPDPGDLWDTAQGRAAPAEARAIVEHLALCAACSEDWRVAAATTAGAPVEAPSAAAATRSIRRSWAVAVAAAAVLVALLGPALVGRFGGEDPVRFREPETAAVRSLVGEAPLPRDRAVLRWSPGPAGARYDLEVATEDLRVVDRARGLDQPTHQIPASALAALASGQRLLWQVEVVAPDGRRTASATFVNGVE
jgi:hypothetical protein